MSVDWYDLKDVREYAIRLGVPAVIFWNGMSYQITHPQRKQAVLDKGYAIIEEV